MFNKIMNFLQSEMIMPNAYGWYHCLAILLVIGFSIFLFIKYKNADEKKVKRFLFVFSLIMIILEIYKQLIFSYNSDGSWSYQWYAFPFQFCSTPMYIAFIASLLKKGKIQDSMFAFLGTYSLFGGIVVMLYPGDVFMSLIGINIQTMVHHGGMILIAVVLYASKSIKLQHKTMLKASCVFLSLVGIATLFNCVYVWLGGTETCNLFFISPYFPSTLPVFSTIYPQVPFIVFWLLYVLSFTFIAYVMLLAAKLINNISSKNKTKKIE